MLQRPRLIIDLQSVDRQQEVGVGRVLGKRDLVKFKLRDRAEHLFTLLSVRDGVMFPLITDIEIDDILSFQSVLA